MRCEQDFKVYTDLTFYTQTSVALHSSQEESQAGLITNPFHRRGT